MECCLAKGELVKLEGRKDGLVLRCTVGTLWLTNGDGIDYLIPTGKRTTLAKGEIALVEALEQSELHLGEPATASDMAKAVIRLAMC
jgi:hypothetical protein